MACIDHKSSFYYCEFYLRLGLSKLQRKLLEQKNSNYHYIEWICASKNLFECEMVFITSSKITLFFDK